MTFAKDPSAEGPPPRFDLGPIIQRSLASMGPAAQGVLKRIGEIGPGALDDAAILSICDRLHPVLPLAVRMAVNKGRLVDFMKNNRNLVIEAARRTGGA